MAISVSLNSDNFERVIYSKEVDFERLITKNAATIFGDKAIYIDAKKKLNTTSLGGTIPDGFLIDMSDSDDPQFYLVEVELQNHDFFRHIFPQITKFFAFYRDSKQRHKLIETIFAFFTDNFGKNIDLTTKIANIIKSKEVYKFLKDIIDNNQNVLIIIDGPKPEFKEIMSTYADTWGKMVKVQIVNHFRRDDDHIITVEPPFQNLPFGDAIAPPPEEETSEPSQYTEEFHFQNRPPKVMEIYEKLKKEFIAAKATLRFNPTKNYIGVVDARRIAYIQLKRKNVHLILLMSEDKVGKIILAGHHKVVSFSESRQRYWGGSERSCALNIYDTNHWDEIKKLIGRLVKKYQET